ncbi:MAG: hypothetical protein BGO67_06575 [Alphaproteobacteria bacterium 41-28]|nr:MAG: hypothetical protein BGO67_06575 [Alphaproteobacteria bacterium 41-28]
MSNIIACLLFNVVGLGSSYFLSLFTSEKNISEKPGTAIFWGFWASMLLTYVLWLFIPNRLDVACYITVAASIIGVGLLLKREGIKPFLKSHYLIALLALSPFIFIIEYIPSGWDEFSHWLMTPKVFYHERTFTPSEISYGFYSYTPLWTLQAAFFQFFTSLNFSETIIYAVRINFFLAFIFFVKEILKIRFLTILLLTLSIFFIFYEFYLYHISVLTIEFPIYILLSATLFLVGSLEKKQLKNTPENVICFLIALLSAYMIKKPLIAVLPAGIFILWINGYKKQLFYFLIAFTSFYFSWYHKPIYEFNCNLWSPKAITVYQQLLIQSFNLKSFFIPFILSMILIFWKNKNVFMFYTLFSIVYFIGTVFTYIYYFGDYESSTLISYERYLANLFVPAYIYALSILFSKAQNFIDVEKHILKYTSIANSFSAVLISVVVGGYFYKTSFAYAPIREHYVRAKNIYDKVKSLYEVKNKSFIAIWQGSVNIQRYLIGYLGYGEISKIEARGSFGPQNDNFWRTVVDNEEEFINMLKKEYDVILVFESDDWLNRIFLKLTNKKTDGLHDFAFVKIKNDYKLIRSDQ